MAEERVQRRLAAILAADVVGYSRLMGEDEAGTRTRFNSHLNELIEPAIRSGQGRTVKTMGDGLLVEFASVVDAVQCAVAIQEGMAERNADEPDDRRIVFRIGINLGDVIIEGDDIHGDGVNVAARLEALADPGGVCVSGMVFDGVRNKLTAGFEDMGEQEVKNIAEPVRAYRVLPEGQQAIAPVRKKVTSRWRNPAIAAIVFIVIVTGGGIAWWQPWMPDMELDSMDKVALPPSDKPSIAVLPFTNMSGDKQQEYFSDGITEDIITDLSKVSGLFVVARSSTLRYKGKPLDVRKVSRELGVRHVLEGSVRKAADRLRITAQLIDGKSGNHVWAERYDRDLKDVFAIQDEISGKVVAKLAVTLKAGHLKRIARKHTPNLEAYDFYLRGRAKRIPPTPKNLTAAKRMFEKAIELDPKFAGGYAGLSFVYSLYFVLRPNQDPEKGLRLARKAVELDDTFGPGYGELAYAYLYNRRFDEALVAIRRAVEMAPSDSLMRARYGRILGIAGQSNEGIKQLRVALRMSPNSNPVLYFLGAIYRAAGQYEQAIAALTELREKRGGRIIPGPEAQLAAAFIQAGRHKDARATVRAIRKAAPRFNLQMAARDTPYKRPGDTEKFLGALREAGLPE